MLDCRGESAWLSGVVRPRSDIRDPQNAVLLSILLQTSADAAVSFLWTNTFLWIQLQWLGRWILTLLIHFWFRPRPIWGISGWMCSNYFDLYQWATTIFFRQYYGFLVARFASYLPQWFSSRHMINTSPVLTGTSVEHLCRLRPTHCH